MFSLNCVIFFKNCLFIAVTSTAARVLMLHVVPGHLIFMYMINFLRAGHTTISPLFALVYLSAAVVQVATLLFICNWMVHHMWKNKVFVFTVLF